MAQLNTQQERSCSESCSANIFFFLEDLQMHNEKKMKVSYFVPWWEFIHFKHAA